MYLRKPVLKWCLWMCERNSDLTLLFRKQNIEVWDLCRFSLAGLLRNVKNVKRCF